MHSDSRPDRLLGGRVSAQRVAAASGDFAGSTIFFWFPVRGRGANTLSSGDGEHRGGLKAREADSVGTIKVGI